MNNKHMIVAAFSLLVLLPGCSNRQTTQSKKGSANMPLKGDKNAKVSFFDNDVEAFVLDEEPTLLNAKNESKDFTWEDAAIEDRFEAICFDYDSAKLRKSEEDKLAQSIEKAAQEKDKIIVCKGHACKYHGTRVYNVAISEQRAQKVAQKFQEKGIKTKVFGVGNEQALPAPMTKEGQSVNRRVEIYTVAA